MKLFLVILLLLLLMTVIVQDFRHKAVSWGIFPLLIITGIIYTLQMIELKENIIQSALSISFILVQWVCLSLYISIKNKKMTSVTTEALGWGDVLFWLFLSVMMPFVNFIIFFLLSLLLIVTGVFMMKIVKQNNNTKIPLAGMQALLFIPLLVIDYTGQWNLWQWIID